jgi:hypothetical protein
MNCTSHRIETAICLRQHHGRESESKVVRNHEPRTKNYRKNQEPRTTFSLTSRGFRPITILDEMESQKCEL